MHRKWTATSGQATEVEHRIASHTSGQATEVEHRIASHTSGQATEVEHRIASHTSGQATEVEHRIASHTSGQAIIETCLSLALLSFVWILVMFSTYMINNRIRTAMAARHASWLKANSGNPSADAIANDFFYVDGASAVEVKLEGGKGSVGGLISGDDQDYGGMAKAYWAEVTFGLDAGSIAATDVFPFTLMSYQLPFMPPSAMADFYQVKSHCQWDDVCKTWDSWQDALSGVWNTIKSVVGDVAGALFGALF